MNEKLKEKQEKKIAVKIDVDKIYIVDEEQVVKVLDDVSDVPEGIPVVEIDARYDHQFNPSSIIEYQYNDWTYFIDTNIDEEIGSKVYDADNIYAYIRDYESADGYDEYSLPTLWGLDPQMPEDVKEVEPGYQGRVRVWKARHWCQGFHIDDDTGWVTVDGYESDDHDHQYIDGDAPMVWASYAEAEKWIDEVDSGRYLVAHNETSRPSYMICAL
jgi:hypothetical protein